MKKERKDYLIIPIANVKNRIDESKNLSEVFTKNYVSKRHQYMVLKLAVCDQNRACDAYELITNEPFFFERPFIKAILTPDNNRLVNIYSKTSVITINPKFVNVAKVKELFYEISEADEVYDYEDSIKEVLLKDKKSIFTKKRIKY